MRAGDEGCPGAARSGRAGARPCVAAALLAGLGAALAGAGCASSTAASEPVRSPPLAIERMRLQLRRGPGAAPCRAIGAGLEACPVVWAGEGEPRFVEESELAEWRASGERGSGLSADAFTLGFLALSVSSERLRVAWYGDAEAPKVLGVVSAGEGDPFAAARLLVLPTKVEALLDDLGLQFLAAVPDAHTLLVLRDEDERARKIALELMAERATGPDALAPGVFFQITPDGLQARPARP